MVHFLLFCHIGYILYCCAPVRGTPEQGTYPIWPKAARGKPKIGKQIGSRQMIVLEQEVQNARKQSRSKMKNKKKSGEHRKMKK